MSLRPLLLSMALVGLAACGTESTVFTTQISRAVALVLSENRSGTSLRERLTPEVLATLDEPILIVSLGKTGSEAGAELQRVAGSLETWSTVNGVQFTFDDGILTSTRGIPGDLMSSDLREVHRTFATRSGDGVRVNRYLNGEDQEVSRALICTIDSAGREQTTVLTGEFVTEKIIETCVSSSETVTNQYWMDNRGLLRRSIQWIGPDAGYVTTERIND